MKILKSSLAVHGILIAALRNARLNGIYFTKDVRVIWYDNDSIVEVVEFIYNWNTRNMRYFILNRGPRNFTHITIE